MINTPLSRSVRGITLIEVLIVLAIIGTIIAIVGPRIFSGQDRANIKTTEILINNYQNALDMYRSDVGTYPFELEHLFTRPDDEDMAARWNGPYMQGTLQKDLWNRPLEYEYNQDDDRYFLYSWGREKKDTSRIGVYPKD